MITAVLEPTAARALTDRIKAGVEVVWELITQAYAERAWEALGYTSWDDYCTREFGTSRLRLPREERAEVVASLRESGLSIRAIESATGISRDTIYRDQREVLRNVTAAAADAEVEVDEDALAGEPIAERPIAPVIGLDGKRYQPKPPRPKETPKPTSPRSDKKLSATAEWKACNRRVLNHYACTLEKSAAAAEEQGSASIPVAVSDARKIAGTLRLTADIMEQVFAEQRP